MISISLALIVSVLHQFTPVAASSTYTQSILSGRLKGLFVSSDNDYFEESEPESVYIVQKKPYLNKGKLELSAMYNVLLGDRFVSTENNIAFAGGVGYFLTEHLALELFGGVFRPTESETSKELSRELGLLSENAQLTQLLWATGLGVQWTPIYGKFQFIGDSLGVFSIYLGLGAGIGGSRVQCVGVEALDQNTFGDQSCSAPTSGEVAYEPEQLQVLGSINGGLRLRFGERFTFRTELRSYIFSSRVYRPDSVQRPAFSDAVRNNIYIQAGFSILLGRGAY